MCLRLRIQISRILSVRCANAFNFLRVQILLDKAPDEELVQMHVDGKRHAFHRRDYESLRNDPTQASVDYYQLFLKMCYPECKNFEFSLDYDEEVFDIDVSSAEICLLSQI